MKNKKEEIFKNEFWITKKKKENEQYKGKNSNLTFIFYENILPKLRDQKKKIEKNMLKNILPSAAHKANVRSHLIDLFDFE